MRLLLAEDEKDLSDALVTVLKHNQYSVDAVFNGNDALDYLTKPFSMKELLARIRAITRRNAQTTDSILQFADLQLNRSTYQLSTEAGSVSLSNREYQMMEMLLTNPGQIISVEQFMDRIWGYDSDAELNVVWVYISYLRKKLSTLQSRVKIKSSRGLGYSISI